MMKYLSFDRYDISSGDCTRFTSHFHRTIPALRFFDVSQSKLFQRIVSHFCTAAG